MRRAGGCCSGGSGGEKKALGSHPIGTKVEVGGYHWLWKCMTSTIKSNEWDILMETGRDWTCLGSQRRKKELAPWGYSYGDCKRLDLPGISTEKEGTGVLPKPFSQAAELAMEGYDFSNTFWRVRCPDGDWKELNRQEVKQGKELATASA